MFFARSEAAARTVREAGPLYWLARRGWNSGGRFGKAGLVLFQTRVDGSVELSSLGCTGERCCRFLFLLGDLGQRALDVELLLTVEWERCELPGGGETVNHLAARSRIREEIGRASCRERV